MLKRILLISILSLLQYSCSQDDSTLTEEPSSKENSEENVELPGEEENESNEEEENSNNCEGAQDFSVQVLETANSLELRALIRSKDGGYIGLNHSEDFHIIKFDQSFGIEWEKTYSGSGIDRAQSIIQTNDNNYVVTGYSNSNDGDFDENYGDYDIWVLKIDQSGELEWKNNYGGNAADGINTSKSLVQTSNGEIAIIGYTKSQFEDSGSAGGYDILFFQITAEGELMFRRTLGGSENDYPTELMLNNSNFYMLLNGRSTDGNFNESGNWIIQLNEEGNIQWKTFLGGINTGSLSIDPSNNFIVAITNFYELILHKLDPNGEILNTNTLTNLGSDMQYSVNDISADNDNYITVTGDLGSGNDQDAFILDLCHTFKPISNKIYSGDNYDKLRSIIPLNDSYLIYGNTYSSNLEDVNNDNTMSTFFLEFTRAD